MLFRNCIDTYDRNQPYIVLSNKTSRLLIEAEVMLALSQSRRHSFHDLYQVTALLALLWCLFAPETHRP